MSSKFMTRLEANKEVRRVLVRHSVDTSKIQFFYQGRSLTFSGALLKEGGLEVEFHIVEAIMVEFARLGMRIGSCELDNWTITESTFTRKSPRLVGDPQKKTASTAAEVAPQPNPKKSKVTSDGSDGQN